MKKNSKTMYSESCSVSHVYVGATMIQPSLAPENANTRAHYLVKNPYNNGVSYQKTRRLIYKQSYLLSVFFQILWWGFGSGNHAPVFFSLVIILATRGQSLF